MFITNRHRDVHDNIANNYPGQDHTDLTIWEEGRWWLFDHVWPDAIEVTENYGSPDGYDWANWKHCVSTKFGWGNNVQYGDANIVDFGATYGIITLWKHIYWLNVIRNIVWIDFFALLYSYTFKFLVWYS